MPASVSIVPVTAVDSVWPLISEGLERACSRTGGDLTSTYLWSETRSGAAFLLVATRGSEVLAAGVFRFETWTSGKKLRALSLYGRDMKSWLPDGLNLLREMMRVGSADRLVFEGRAGWARALGNTKMLRTVFEAEL